jgi:hypothetical protein
MNTELSLNDRGIDGVLFKSLPILLLVQLLLLLFMICFKTRISRGAGYFLSFKPIPLV